MHTIFKTTGKFHWLTDANGDPIKNDWSAWNVGVEAKYELRPSPHQPLVLDIFGYNLVASPQCTYKLVLDNGVVLTGRARGGLGSFSSEEPPKLRNIRMFDVDQTKLELHPEEATSETPDIDAAVFSVVSSGPFGIGNGFARPSMPFTYTTNPEQLRKWTTQALRLHHRNLEITVVGTSNYWRELVDARSLHHESIVGIRRVGGGDLRWDDLNGFTYLLSNFLGWLNHCASPVFHIKGYNGGRLVYRGYDLHPHATVQRDSFAWFPKHGVLDDGGDHAQGDLYAHLMQNLLHCFATAWEKNVAVKGTFHIALQMLRGGDKGGPRVAPSMTYLRDAFTACAMAERMLTGTSGRSGRSAQIARCLKEIRVADKLPGLDKQQTDFTIREHPELWRAANQGHVLQDERTRATMSRPLANIDNWLLHLDDPHNAERLLGLGTRVQQYMVEVSIWLADLMLMKVVGYNGWYLNRLTRATEKVPWAT